MSRSGDVSRPSSRMGRRLSSAPHSIFTSLENASSRLSLNSFGRRSASNTRSVSSMGSHRQEEDYDEFEPVHRVPSASYTTTLPPDSPTTYGFLDARGSMTKTSYVHATDRRAASTSNLLDDASSIKSTNSAPKWYKRFSRTNSENRLSKALETSEAAFTTPAKPHNPYARQRSSPIMSKKSSIIGQSAAQAVEIGGHASNASQILPRALLPESNIEVPYIVDTCISWLVENQAHLTPGIFRINGSNQSVKAALEHFSSGCVRMPLQDIQTPSGQLLTVFDIASCLKKFLVLLPGGLFGQACFEDLLDLCEDDMKSPGPQIARDISHVIKSISEEKRNIIYILFAFLRFIADHATQLAARDDASWQEAGYMNAQSLSIVFSPTCLGTKEGSTDMSRSSTAQSDRSFHSDSTSPIEEAVAIAKQGAAVVRLLITRWSEVVLILRPAAVEDTITTLPDSKPKLHSNGDQSHARTESVDTVTMKRCTCEITIPILSAQIESLEQKVARLEKQNLEATEALRQKSEEITNLYSRNLQLEREFYHVQH